MHDSSLGYKINTKKKYNLNLSESKLSHLIHVSQRFWEQPMIQEFSMISFSKKQLSDKYLPYATEAKIC